MLLFDFDGILIDSVNEVVVTAYNAATGELVTSLEGVPTAVTRSFLLNRFHFRLAGESIPLMRWCIEEGARDPERLLSAGEYTALIDYDPGRLKERTERFFATRAVFLERDRTAWLTLNAPYEPLFSQLKLAGAGRIVILTNKNRAAVLEITHHFGLPLLAENIYSGDHGTTKIENLARIRERFRAERYSFIDDSLENLREVDAHCRASRVPLQPLLGAWGYIGPGDIEHAETLGYAVYGQQDLIELLATELPE